MANLDRAGMIDLLGRLGAESDETVLQAARELTRAVGESGLAWDDLIRPNVEAAGADAEPVDEPGIAIAAGDVPVGGKAEVARLIERLLARKTISDTLREELTEFKGAIADGSFDDMDADYVRALAKRLGL
jgi:hypothetical protein